MTPPDGTWRWFNQSKFEATCCYCNNPIPLTAGRWTNKTDGKRWNACGACLKPPETPPQRNDPPPMPQTTMKPFESREDAIAKAHQENMESSKQLRNVLALLITAIEQQTQQIKRRNDILEQEAKK